MAQEYITPRVTTDNLKITLTFRTSQGNIRLHFYKPEQILELGVQLMNAAIKVWPNHEMVKMYAENNFSIDVESNE